MKISSVFVGVLLATGAQAQNGAYQQCGGPNWSGSTECVSGFYCFYQNQWYSQCIPGTAGTTATTSTTLKTSTTSKPATSSTTSKATSTTSTTGPISTGSGKFKWFGINESGAEFGQGAYPGVWGKDFIFPDNGALDVCS